MLSLDKTVTTSRMPMMFIGFLVAFVVTLIAINLASIQEKLGFETRTTALVKLENANNEIEKLLAINKKLSQELELKNKVQLVTATIINDLATENINNKKILDKINNAKTLALQQIEQEVYIDDYLDAPKSQYELPVEKPLASPVNDSVNNSNINNKPATPAPKTVKPKTKEQTESQINRSSEIQIAALWDTYDSLHRN